MELALHILLQMLFIISHLSKEAGSSPIISSHQEKFESEGCTDCFKKNENLQEYSDNKQRRVRRLAVLSRRWPDGVVPYEIDPDSPFTPEFLLNIDLALKNISSVSCVKFVAKNDSHQDYIFIKRAADCSSGIGRVSGRNDLLLSSTCSYVGGILHELMHALGFLHEHQRHDRNRYIQIIMENFVDSMSTEVQQQIIKRWPSYYSQGFPYDYESILHYHKNVRSKEGLETIRAKNLTITKLGGDKLSNIDIQRINKFYECQNNRETSVTTTKTETASSEAMTTIKRTQKLITTSTTAILTSASLKSITGTSTTTAVLTPLKITTTIADQLTTMANNPSTTTEKPTATTDKRKTTTVSPITTAKSPISATEKPKISTEKPKISTEKPTIVVVVVIEEQTTKKEHKSMATKESALLPTVKPRSITSAQNSKDDVVSKWIPTSIRAALPTPSLQYILPTSTIETNKLRTAEIKFSLSPGPGQGAFVHSTEIRSHHISIDRSIDDYEFDAITRTEFITVAAQHSSVANNGQTQPVTEQKVAATPSLSSLKSSTNVPPSGRAEVAQSLITPTPSVRSSVPTAVLSSASKNSVRSFQASLTTTVTNNDVTMSTLPRTVSATKTTMCRDDLSPTECAHFKTMCDSSNPEHAKYYRENCRKTCFVCSS